MRIEVLFGDSWRTDLPQELTELQFLASTNTTRCEWARTPTDGLGDLETALKSFCELPSLLKSACGWATPAKMCRTTPKAARHLQVPEAASLLEKTLNEEKKADAKLTEIGERILNPQAARQQSA